MLISSTDFNFLFSHPTQNNPQRTVYALHIIDALILGGVDIRARPLAERNALCTKFAAALNRPLWHLNANPVRPIPVRAKQMFAFADMGRFFDSVTITMLERSGTDVIGCEVERFDPRETKRFYIPRAVLFLRHSQDSSGSGTSPRKVLNFDRSFRSRQAWMWNRTDQLYSANTAKADFVKEPGLVYRADFEEFIDEFEDDD